MYKCYACGKELEHPGETCPYCRFPVISTLHGDKKEEDRIREFAEEYKRANPQFFSTGSRSDVTEKRADDISGEAAGKEEKKYQELKAKYEKLLQEQETERLRKKKSRKRTIGILVPVLLIAGFLAYWLLSGHSIIPADLFETRQSPASSNTGNSSENAAPSGTAETQGSTVSSDTAETGESPDSADSEAQGKVFNIYAWNDEFKGLFEEYYTVPEDITVNWIINTNEDGIYQQKLDEALQKQSDAADDDKIDMFLAEADNIYMYVNSAYTMDIESIGFKNADTMYGYTIEAASDENGICKGVSFQCCPAAVIYRKSIARDVLGTDDPAEVQAALDTWDKFDAAAAEAKEKGYYMTASFEETFHAFSSNCSIPWVDDDNNVQFDPMITAWIEQAENYVANGYTLTAGIWDTKKTDEMYITGKTMCFFGPAWYYNYSMKNAMDPVNGCPGDWCIIKGPQAYFWGGTWLMAAAGSDNTEMLRDIFETFTINEEVCAKLVENENQYPNNIKVAEKYASDASYGNTTILDGQNDIAVFAELAEDIKWENHTYYDGALNNALMNNMQEYLNGYCSYEAAIENFYNQVKEIYPELNVPQT